LALAGLFQAVVKTKILGSSRTGRLKVSSRCSALYQSHNQYNQGDNKKEVDQGSSHMADESEQPEHQ